jgi:hypothetical protein
VSDLNNSRFIDLIKFVPFEIMSPTVGLKPLTHKFLFVYPKNVVIKKQKQLKQLNLNDFFVVVVFTK